jgi:phosphoribosylformylglycinamidine synthase
MTIGGDIGAEIDVSNINKNLRTDFKIFSESNTRWVVEIKKKSKTDFEKILKKQNAPFIKIGLTKEKNLVIKDQNKEFINIDISVLRNLWKNAIWDVMG